MVDLGRRQETLALLLVLVGACGQRGDPLLSIAGPTDIVRFELADAQGRTLWVIDSRRARHLRFIHYGEIPEGFHQAVPADGSRPRPLVDGEPLIAETRTLSRVFVHYGNAVGPASFRAAYSSMVLIGRPKSTAQ